MASRTVHGTTQKPQLKYPGNWSTQDRGQPPIPVKLGLGTEQRLSEAFGKARSYKTIEQYLVEHSQSEDANIGELIIDALNNEGWHVIKGGFGGDKWLMPTRNQSPIAPWEFSQDFTNQTRQDLQQKYRQGDFEWSEVYELMGHPYRDTGQEYLRFLRNHSERWEVKANNRTATVSLAEFLQIPVPDLRNLKLEIPKYDFVW